ncbi:MAG: AIR synthase-related protein [Planctomycetota bacterium]
MTTIDAAASAPTGRVHRFAVTCRQDLRDPEAARLTLEAAELGIEADSIRFARVYLIEADLTDEQAALIARELLTDPVAERMLNGEAIGPAIEVHPLPGVMDPAAQSVADAIADLIGLRPPVQTGRRYEFGSLTADRAEALITRLRANTVIHRVHRGTFVPEALPAGSLSSFQLTHIPIRELDDAGLEQLSRDGHLFLDLHEMRAVRDEYCALGREPTDIELETIAQTWSEHCVHKTLKSTIRYTGMTDDDPIDWTDRPGHTRKPDGSVTIDNLLKSTVAAATFELIEEGLDWTLSVFVDNAGIIRFDDDTAICVKVETHNHPSAIEPYGGAATGIGGCIRDIIGTGLAAKPIASTDVFCVGTPTIETVPEGCIPPMRVLDQVVAGVRDYGNRMGIPTLNGAVWFDDRYVGNPLVYCGCVGIMPTDKIEGHAKPGDLIVALGGRTGRDGIHGATFSSAELTDTHADEFSHAVQIGNAIEEKRVLDAILRARDAERGCLFSAITDCGAGGFSSAVGEMGEHVGATVHLDRAPLKYDGLTYTEIWISEAQERMVLAVPEGNLTALQAICDEEHVELAVLGTFGVTNDAGEPELVLNYHEHEVGRLPMPFLHDGIPTPTREAVWTKPKPQTIATADEPPTVREALLTLLAHPNIASKRSIIRQYDHEVQGNTVLKPLVGPGGEGPGDAAVIEPVPGSGKGLAIACGLATNVGDPALGGDPYEMALAAIDECVRNLVCVGADPDRIAILDNFCWPSCKKPENLASLVRAAEGCYDGAKAYRTPFISGKDSLNNQFTTKEGTTIEIPPTLLITGVGIVHDVTKCVTMDAKRAGNRLVAVTPESLETWMTSCSHYETTFSIIEDALERRQSYRPTNPNLDASVSSFVAELISEGVVKAAHDVSDGGLLVAVAEMLVAGNESLGAEIDEDAFDPDPAVLFGEPRASFVLEIDPDEQVIDRMSVTARERGYEVRDLGRVVDTPHLSLTPWKQDRLTISVADLADAWLNGITL